MVDDICLISLGNLTAHFSLYQPDTQGSNEFCEDIPDAALSVFVIDFVHDILTTMPVEVEIYKDINQRGFSATWKDVQAISDDSATVFYKAPTLYPSGGLQVTHSFSENGGYIGVVNAIHPATGKTYRAVFPFRVGSAGFWSYLPGFLLLLVAIELFYWLSNGGWARWRAST